MARSKSSASGVRVAGDPDAGRLDLLINEKPVGVMTQLGNGWRVAWGKGDALEYDADSQEAAVAYVRANVAQIKSGRPAPGGRERGFSNAPTTTVGLLVPDREPDVVIPAGTSVEEAGAMLADSAREAADRMRDVEPQPATADAPTSPQNGESGAAPSERVETPDAAPQPVDAGLAPATEAAAETPVGAALAALGVDPNAPQPEPAPTKAKREPKAKVEKAPAAQVEPVLDANGQPYPYATGAPATIAAGKWAGECGVIIHRWAAGRVVDIELQNGFTCRKREPQVVVTGPAVERPKAERAPKAPKPVALDQVLAFIEQADKAQLEEIVGWASSRLRQQAMAPPAAEQAA